MIYLLNKPLGWTSFDLVKKVRNLVQEKKVGHAGTLDPLATGLMIVATGKDTKKLADLVGLDKTYLAKILIGQTTDTLDQEGVILKSQINDAINISDVIIKNKVDSLKGCHKLPVPIYSAVKVDGKPLYKYAREGNAGDIELPVRKMEVLAVDLKDIIKDSDRGIFVTVELRVASGVYIRSLAKYLGDSLDCPAMLWELSRTKVGDFNIEDSISIQQLVANAKIRN